MNKKVLVVEDSSYMRSLIASTIDEINGCEVIEAGNGFEALRMLPVHKFAIIITDINMPDINGLEIVNFVKSSPSYKDIPLIIVTTEQSEEDRKKGIALGASEYITKPFDPEDLKDIVKKVLKY
ncbi:MAG: response regulator [Nitrospirota bacterium]